MPRVNAYSEPLPRRYPHIFPVYASIYGSISSSPPSSPTASTSRPDPEAGLPMAGFKFLPGNRVIIKGPPIKRGTLLNSPHIRDYCRHHDITTDFYLIRMDWTSSWWQIILLCIYFPCWLLFKVVYCPSKFILKYTGILFCVSWLLQRCRPSRILCVDWCINFTNNILDYCSLLLGRTRWVCAQAMEEESKYDRRISRKAGIQGYKNSCYLDAFLFSMFFASNAFDAILEDTENSNEFSKKIKSILLNDIAIPLRQDGFVSAKQVWKLRENLRHLNPKITGSFMAIEDIVYLIFELALDAPKFLHFSIGQIVHSEYMQIMYVDIDDPCPVITIQKNFEASLRVNGNMKLLQVPSPALILSLPWENGEILHHEAIIPTFELDLRPLLKNWGKLCTKCGQFEATYESIDKDSTGNELLCDVCMVKVEWTLGKYVSRTVMKLTALMCYRGSHFTTFVRKSWPLGGHKEEWFRFDSMAGDSLKVVPVEDLMESVNLIIEGVLSGGKLPYSLTSHQRAFCYDGHTCIYEPVFYNPY